MNWLKKQWRKLRFWYRAKTNPDNDQPQVEPPIIIRPKPRVEPIENGTVPHYEYTEKDKKRRLNMYYEALYATMMLKQNKMPRIEKVVARIEKNKSRYTQAEILTGVDWRIIGVIHSLEASGRFSRQILNGQRYTQRTTIVPEHQGPWKTWEESCIAAFKYHPLKSHKIYDVLRYLEKYNGWGYVKRDINSPYLWSYSNHYAKGKYTSDGHFSAHTVSQQVGAAVLLKALGF